jgi:bacterioferritin-associated ferredoxin
MNNFCSRSSCDDCPGRVVCRCLQVTEDALVDALMTLELRTLKEVRQHTGAGDGCTACHHRIQAYLERHAYSSSPSICSVK